MFDGARTKIRFALFVSSCELIPIGSSDYALSRYALDETPGDLAMEHFSIARDRMAPALEAISNVLPMSYAVDGMNEVLHHTEVTGNFVRDVLIVSGCALLVLALGAATLRRRTT